MVKEISIFDPGCEGGNCPRKETCPEYVDNIDRGVTMNWLKHATILSIQDWLCHINTCIEQQPGGHLAIVSGSLMPGADTSYPNPPFLCYSILQQDVDLNNDIAYKWVHVCFTAIDAGIIAAYNMIAYEASMKKKREEIAATAPERQKKLAEDLDTDEEETLDPVSLRDAMEIAEEIRLQGG